MTSRYVRDRLSATRKHIPDPTLEVDQIRDRLGDALDGVLTEAPEEQSYDLLASWAALMRVRPDLVDARNARNELAAAKEIISATPGRLAELALAFPNPSAWLAAAKQFAESLKGFVEAEQETCTACDLLTDLDEADLVAYAVRAYGYPALELERQLGECNEWLAENATCFCAAGVLVQAVGQALSPDLAQIDPALGRTAEKYAHILDALEMVEADLRLEGSDVFDLEALEHFYRSRALRRPAEGARAPTAPDIPLLISLSLVAVALRAGRISGFRGAAPEPAAQGTEPGTWNLLLQDGSEEIPLPPEVAQQCYGAPVQTVTLRLHRSPDPARPNWFRPQLEMSPPPKKGGMVVTMVFAEGEERVFRLPRRRGVRMSSFSEPVASLPGEAFGSEQWPVSLRSICADGGDKNSRPC